MEKLLSADLDYMKIRKMIRHLQPKKNGYWFGYWLKKQ